MNNIADNTSFSFEDNDDNEAEVTQPQATEAYSNMTKAVEEALASDDITFSKEDSILKEDNIDKDILISEEGLSESLDKIAFEEKISSYEHQISELKDQVLRNVAETENVRRRSRAELDKSNKYAITGFARDMIGVVENLHRAVDNISEDSIESDALLKNLYDGVSMTLRELENVMVKHGITRIYPQGEMFDHNLHQAMVQIDTAESPAGTIIQVMQAGYSIHDRLLQPAMVGVAKTPANDESASDDKHVNTEA